MPAFLMQVFSFIEVFIAVYYNLIKSGCIKEAVGIPAQFLQAVNYRLDLSY